MLPRSAAALAVAAVATLVITGCGPIVEVEPTASVELAVPPETSVVVDRSGATLAELHAEQDREPVPLDAVPAILRDAVVAVEDARFYEHGGVDGRAIARAVLENTREGRVAEGGSTITQQLAKNLSTGDAQTLGRKFEEASVALQLEAEMTKDDILERYLNTVYFGQGAYGVQAAARRYLGVDVGEVDLAGASLLTGLLRAPSRYDPYTDPDAARDRRDVVLDVMARRGVVSDTDAKAAQAEPLALRPAEDATAHRAPYFVGHVLDQLQHDPRFAALGDDPVSRADVIFQGGLEIATTLDPRWQEAAEHAAEATTGQPGDPTSAVVAIDPASGGIRALVGGRDWNDPDDPAARYNLATQAQRQPASTFKTIALAAALDAGWTLEDRLPAPAQVELGATENEPEPWTVSNHEDRDYEEVSLRDATVWSVNTPFAELADAMGAERITELAADLGVTTPLEPYRSVVLGAQEVSVLEVASVHATIAAGGVHRPPSAVTRITAPDGEVLYERGLVEGERVLDADVAWLVTSALEDVVSRGTGQRAALQRPVAGKTGTSTGSADAWFTGYTPDLAAAVWIGFPEGRRGMVPPATRTRVEGGTWPAELFARFGVAALADQPAKDFAAPDSALVRVTIDAEAGCLPTAFTPPDQLAERPFVAGSEPTEDCPEPDDAPVADVPDVSGLDADAAETVLADAGFTVEQRRQHSGSLPPGLVLRQDPSPGEDQELIDGYTAVIWSSSADRTTAEVPDVLGDALDDAVTALEKDGFVVEIDRACPDGQQTCTGAVQRPETVWEQRPDAGANPPRHSVVELSAYPSAPDAQSAQR